MTAMVCLPGWAMGPAAWTPLARELPGIVAHPLPLPMAAPDAGAALSAMADRLAQALPAGATLCGWSLGALLALALAGRHPQRIARLVLIGATPRFTAAADWPHAMAPATLADFRAALAEDPGGTVRRFCALQARGDAGGRTLARALLETSVAADAPRLLPQLAAGLDILAGADLRSLVPEVRQPVLLLAGEHDALMPPTATLWLCDALPRARAVILPQRGHAPQLADPATVAAHIRRWLAAPEAP